MKLSVISQLCLISPCFLTCRCEKELKKTLPFLFLFQISTYLNSNLSTQMPFGAGFYPNVVTEQQINHYFLVYIQRTVALYKPCALLFFSFKTFYMHSTSHTRTHTHLKRVYDVFLHPPIFL